MLEGSTHSVIHLKIVSKVPMKIHDIYRRTKTYCK